MCCIYAAERGHIHSLLVVFISSTHSLIGDWERRNLCGVYESAYLILVRDFAQAAKLLNKAVATFTCYPLMSYNVFVFYTGMPYITYCAVLMCIF